MMSGANCLALQQLRGIGESVISSTNKSVSLIAGAIPLSVAMRLEGLIIC